MRRTHLGTRHRRDLYGLRNDGAVFTVSPRALGDSREAARADEASKLPRRDVDAARLRVLSWRKGGSVLPLVEDDDAPNVLPASRSA